MHGTIIKIFWVCLCSLRYTACNAHEPYCHLWPARLYNIFPHYLINGTIFENYLLSFDCALIFYTVLSETFLFIRTERRMMIYIYIYIFVFMWSNRLSCQILLKLEFSQQIFAKYSNIKSVWREPSCSIRTEGKRDRQKLTPTFRNFANSPINDY